MFTKILIANCSEIACRVITATHRTTGSPFPSTHADLRRI